MDFFNSFQHFLARNLQTPQTPNQKNNPKQTPPPQTTNIVVLSNQQNPNQNTARNLLINYKQEIRKK